MMALKHKHVEDFIICDFTSNANRKPKDTKRSSFEANFTEAMAIDDLGLKVVAPSSFKGMLPEEKALRKYMKDEGLKLFVSETCDSEMFVNAPSGFSAVVLLDKDVTAEDADVRLVTIAHEVGHYLDYKHNFDYDSDAFGSESIHPNDEIVTEAVAWAYAKDLLEVLGYTNWDCFFEVALDALSTYTYDEALADQLLKNMPRVKYKREMTRMMMCH